MEYRIQSRGRGCLRTLSQEPISILTYWEGGDECGLSREIPLCKSEKRHPTSRPHAKAQPGNKLKRVSSHWASLVGTLKGCLIWIVFLDPQKLEEGQVSPRKYFWSPQPDHPITLLSEIRITVPAMGPGSWGRLLPKDPWKSWLSKSRAKEGLRTAMEGADASKKRSISWGPCPRLSPSLRDRCSALGLHIAHPVTKWTWEERSAGRRIHNLTLQRWENQVTGCPGLSDVRSKADSVSGSSKFCNLCFTKCFIKEPVTHCYRNKNFLFRSFILSCYFTQVNYWLWQANPTGNSRGQSDGRLRVLERLSAGAAGTLRSSHPVSTAHSPEQNSAHHLWFRPQDGHQGHAYIGHAPSCLPPAATLLHSTTGRSSRDTVTCQGCLSHSLQDQDRCPKLLWQNSAFLALGVSGSLFLF